MPGNEVELQANLKVEGVFILCISKPYDDALRYRVMGGIEQVRVNIGVALGALFAARASLSVDRTCLRYPCARLTQESSAI
jgi:two-component system sensor histidine kinase AlgZ